MVFQAEKKLGEAGTLLPFTADSQTVTYILKRFKILIQEFTSVKECQTYLLLNAKDTMKSLKLNDVALILLKADTAKLVRKIARLASESSCQVIEINQIETVFGLMLNMPDLCCVAVSRKQYDDNIHLKNFVDNVIGACSKEQIKNTGGKCDKSNDDEQSCTDSRQASSSKDTTTQEKQQTPVQTPMVKQKKISCREVAKSKAKSMLKNPQVEKYPSIDPKTETEILMRLQALANCFENMNAFRKWLLTGVNETTRFVERDQAAVVFVDAGAHMIPTHVMQLCAVRQCCCVRLKTLQRTMCGTLGTGRLTCLGVRKAALTDSANASANQQAAAFVDYVQQVAPKLEPSWLTFENDMQSLLTEYDANLDDADVVKQTPEDSSPSQDVSQKTDNTNATQSSRDLIDAEVEDDVQSPATKKDYSYLYIKKCDSTAKPQPLFSEQTAMKAVTFKTQPDRARMVTTSEYDMIRHNPNVMCFDGDDVVDVDDNKDEKSNKRPANDSCEVVRSKRPKVSETAASDVIALGESNDDKETKVTFKYVQKEVKGRRKKKQDTRYFREATVPDTKQNKPRKKAKKKQNEGKFAKSHQSRSAPYKTANVGKLKPNPSRKKKAKK